MIHDDAVITIVRLIDDNFDRLTLAALHPTVLEIKVFHVDLW